MLYKKHKLKKATQEYIDGALKDEADRKEKPFVPVVDKKKLAKPKKDKPVIIEEEKKIIIEEPKPDFAKLMSEISAINAGIKTILDDIDALKKTDAEVHSQLPSEDDNLEEMKKEAKRISKEEGVVQHVNKVSDGVYKIDDFYDADTTEISYENGRQL